MADAFTGRERQIASDGGVLNRNNTDKWEHWKYPETVGNGTGVDDINFNSNETSVYAKLRMSAIDEGVNEPFVMFEFLKIQEELGKLGDTFYQDTASNASSGTKAVVQSVADIFNDSVDTITNMSILQARQAPGNIVDAGRKSVEEVKSWGANKMVAAENLILAITTPAKRDYTGSIALYMPTDIQVNDTMVYNEDSRKFAAAFRELVEGGGGAFANKAVTTSKAAFAAYGYAASKMIPKMGGALGAIAGFGLGDIVGAEMQRATGQMLNPNEFIAYTSTGLRTFTFNWTFLPDSKYESDQAAGIIKFFRKSAHAKKNDPITVTVPDHCIVSFHGAKDMIQLPPCVIENVSVTYNPNVTSFFKHGNAPVEIGLTVGLKEMVPIYNEDVEKGY